MSWFVPYVPERVCKYLLQRYLGQFFEEKLSLDQLSVDLFKGKGRIEKVSLDVQALNELGEKQNWPLEFVDGYIDRLTLMVPWSRILKDSSSIEVHGLKLTLQPKQRKDCATSMFESMWSSMSNSMQLAQECIKQEAPDSAQPLEGIERFAHMIESVLSRIKVTFFNVVIQVEHVPQDGNGGVGIVINIDRVEYSDEAGNDPPPAETSEEAEGELNSTYIVPAFTTKNFRLEGVTFSTVEFPCKARTFSKSVMSQSQTSVNGGDKEKEDSYVALVKDRSDDANTSGESIEVLEEYRHVVLCGKLCGSQEISIRIKQLEVVAGPKMSFQINLGALLVFLSPRQVHLLLELADGLASPDNEDTSNVAPKQRCTEKPMTAFDYQRIEQELQQQLHPLSTLRAPGLQSAQGWSTAALEDSDTDEIFHPMKSPYARTSMSDSACSAASSSMESSITSSMASTTFSDATKQRSNEANLDPTAEISHFQIRVTSLALLVLHEDVLSVSADEEHTLVPASVRQMQSYAEKFFASINSLAFMGSMSRDFSSSRASFEQACSLSHLRLLAARLHVEGDETTTSSAFSITGKLTVARMELLECLQETKTMEYVPLLTFANLFDVAEQLTTTPCLKLNFKHCEKTASNGSRRVSKPQTEIAFVLDSCTIELDLTIVDRICALLNPQPICIATKPQRNVWAQENSATQQVESFIDVKLSCNCLSIKLRFPIPDFRPLHDIHRIPWWKRHVRSDFLLLKLHQTSAQTAFQTNQPASKYSLQCSNFDVLYYENALTEPFVIAKAGSAEKNTNCELVFTMHPKKKEEFQMEPAEEKEYDMTQSIYGSFGNEEKKKDPFSAKRIIHESDTRHERQEDSEELIIPGDKEEINNFVAETTKNSRIQIDLNLPTVTMQLVSKHIYEVIYNRINNDLLLWEPSAPKPKIVGNDKFMPSTSLMQETTQDTFSMCKSGIQYVDSDTESDDEQEADGSSVFYSIYETRAKQKQQFVPVRVNAQSYLSLNLCIGQGLLNMNPPVRDSAGNVIPGQQGEFLLWIEKVHLFVVSGYCGDDDLGYICVQARDGHLHHCDMMSIPSQSAPLKEIGTAIGRHLHSTICKSEPGVLVNADNRGGDREMISIAIRIQAKHETHHVKTVRVAVGINKATLNHRMCSEPNSWISHFCDFFNVLDYPISGYVAKDVLTELHLHLWDCAVDYRPLYLPLRAVVTLGNFSLSSHLSAQANSSTLRFIAEDAALFLSDKAPPRDGIASLAPADLKRDYVRVIDLSLFEVSLRTNDKKSNINPHIDLRASNDTVHIRTCADSARALTQLLTYYASDGDLEAPTSDSVSSTHCSPLHRADEAQLVNVEQQVVSNLTKSQHERINTLLGEAMQENVSDEEETPVLLNDGAKLFFFPDENVSLKDLGRPLPQVAKELGDVKFSLNKSSDTDEEFCIVENEVGTGLLPKNGLPEIRWLTNEPIRIIDNHFPVPLGKTDILKAPEHFPAPILRYTLCEMSIIWHMYGGSDFKPANKDKKKSVNFADLQISNTVRYTTTNRGSVSFAERKRANLPWQIAGGPNRDHDVLMELQLNKVRLQHETYPEHTTQASRQVLLVSEFEIRDRLASSEINKFLYQYTSQARPKQSHAHMLVIKALHIRPDPKLKTQECCLRISLLPLRLNIDQDTLLFLIRFFNELGGRESSTVIENTPSRHNTPTHHPPIMTVSTVTLEVAEQAQKIVDDNLLILLEESKIVAEDDSATATRQTQTDESLPIYFRSVLFSPDVLIRLDYHGKRVDMTHGPLPGLLMGLGQLNCSELRLKRLSNRHGILGVDKLFTYLITEWLNDIKRNQLPSLLGGVGPMRSLVQLMQGIRDLFWLPIEQYQKDGRIVRGIQRGANSFTTSTAMAALELTSRIIHLIQITAETAYDMLSPGPSVRRIAKGKGKKKRYSQPQDIREGMANAYTLVKEGIGETADTIVRVASHEHEQKGYSGAVGGVLRQIPPTIFKPIIIASEATSNVLGGVKSQLVPDARREASQKWRSDDN